MITLPEFLNLVKDIERPSEMGCQVARDYYSNEKDVNFNDIYLNFIWMVHETGGVSGGSCWDDSDPQRYYKDDDIPEFLAFDEVVTKVVPNLPYLHYKVICSEFVKEIEYIDEEYYGNCTDYVIKYVSLCDLYAYLIDHDLLK